MQLPSIDTGNQIFIVALLLIAIIGVLMFIHPEESNTYLTFLGGIFTGFLAASLDLKKAKNSKIDDTLKKD
tara:strand:- start:157 stop:369 length:213 start_codon:yes stop_codon:yes gene_type:complete